MANIEPYTSDLTDLEWEIVRRLLPIKGKLGRPPRYKRRLAKSGKSSVRS